MCCMCCDSVNKCFMCVLGFVKKNDICVKICGIGYYFDMVCKFCDLCCVDCEVRVDNCILCVLLLFRKGKDCVENCIGGFKFFLRLLVRFVNGNILFEGRVEVREFDF